MINKLLKYSQKNIVENLKKYLEEILIIEKTQDSIKKKIKETIKLCNDIEISLKEGTDDYDYIDEDISTALENLKLIKRCYECLAVITNDTTNKEYIDDFNKKISFLIENEILKLKVLI